MIRFPTRQNFQATLHDVAKCMAKPSGFCLEQCLSERDPTTTPVSTGNTKGNAEVQTPFLRQSTFWVLPRTDEHPPLVRRFN